MGASELGQVSSHLVSSEVCLEIDISLSFRWIIFHCCIGLLSLVQFSSSVFTL